MRIVRMFVAIIGVFFFLLIRNASADTTTEPRSTEITQQISEISSYNPYLLDLTFDNKEAMLFDEITSWRDDLLAKKWKNKQIHLWDALSAESLTINASAYTAAADECGNDKGITASGLVVAEHRTLACPKTFPFGAKINIEGMGTFTCEDRGGAIKGNHFDIYMKTKSEAFAFGRQNLVASIVK
jgi:3D (Asp-Asp-Asp) domain-containing protein